ncbi:MAG TPA: Ig-like domain-containing protein [Gemmatimonadales bacterium]|nr:Ig-like domain-containing protein [Gemmatimonadales bacterium]
MTFATFALAALALQQPAPPAAPQAAPSPIARLVITPEKPTMIARDSLRFSAVALDAAGQPVPNATINFFGAGGRFEGRVDSTGMLRSGSTGFFNVRVVATVAGTRPVIQTITVPMLPGPAAKVTVSPTITRLVAGQRMRYTAASYSAADDRRDDVIRWRSSAPAILRVTPEGYATAVAAGRATLIASAGTVEERLVVQVVPNTIASVTLTPGTASARTGDVIQFQVNALTAAGRRIEGLTPQWSMSGGQGQITPDGAFVGYDAGEYVVTASFGTRTADAVITLTPRDVRRQVTLVGRLPRTRFTTEEVWVHPNGKVAYLGSGSGGDVLYAIDISDPSKPVVTDSVQSNTRRVNDVMTTPDGKTLVFTREGASDRKNGIVICDLADPLHPRVISEFTDGVPGGVHSAFIYRDARYGTNIFLTNDGTGALHVVNIDDPAHPRQLATWQTERPDAGRTLHDVDVQDGLAYLSYWNDGLVVLDVGNGIKGGTPSDPRLVMQYKYDLNALYRDVERSAGPGFIRGTHTAWRHGKYVFIADEVFPNGPTLRNGRDASAGRAYGRLQVIDVSDWNDPHAVAWYEPEYGGVHNVWVAGDTLYMGAYNAGFRAFDISGELRGDLRAQGREMAHVNTADMEGNTRNSAMTWGVVVKNDLAFVNDDNNGLWIVRMEPRQPPAAVP